MLCKVQITGEPDAALNAINRVRVLHELQPYWAPPRRYQLGSIAALIGIVAALTLI